MTKLTASPILHLIRRLIGDQRVNELPDQEMLRRFKNERDEAAFHGLLRRYGQMVLDVCRNVLGNEHDAEDAFQTTFLILAQKAGAIREEASVGNWLYGVAYRVALKAQAEGGKRQKHEALASGQTRSGACDDPTWRDVQQVLHAELNRFPERYRAPLVLCYLQGQTQDAAARLLGVSKAALKKRLERARALLRARLLRRGLGPAVVLAASAWPMGSATARLPVTLVASTARAATIMAAGGLRVGIVSARVLALKESVVNAMFMTKFTIAKAFLAVAGVAALAGGALLYCAPATEQPTGGRASAVAKPPPPDQHGDPLPPGVVARLGSTRLRPGGSIEHLAFSPDGKQLASCHQEMYVTDSLTIWDAADGRELRRVDLSGVQVAHWQWLADGRGMAVLQVDGVSYLWEFSDATAKPPTSRFGLGGGRVAAGGGGESSACFAVSPDGKRLVGGTSKDQAGKEQPIHVWDLATNKKVGELPKPQLLAKQPDNCSALFFTPDGRRLIAFSPTKKDKGETKEYLIVVWDAGTGKEQLRFTNTAPMTQGTRMSAAVSNQLLALGMEDEPGTVVLRDLSTGQSRVLTTKHAFRPNNGFGVSAITFSADGRALVTAGRGGEIKLWDTATLKALREIPKASLSWIETLAVSPDGKTLASGGQDHVIRLWELATGEEREPQGALTGEVTGVRFCADAKLALTFCSDGTLRVWDTATGRQLRTMPLPPNSGGWPRGEIAPDGRTLLTNAGDHLNALDVTTGKDIKLPNLPPNLPCDALRFGTDGKTIVALSADKVTLLEWPAVKVRRTITLPPPERKPGATRCDAADLSPDGRWLITLGHCEWSRQERGLNFGYAADGVLDLWDAATGKRVRRLLASPGVARSVLYTAGGDVVLAGDGGTLKGVAGESTELHGDLNLIDPLTSRLKHKFARPPGSGFRYITATALSADGRLLFTGSNDGSVVAYEVLTGEVRQRLDGYRGLIRDLAGSKNSQRLIGGGLGLNALVWDVSLARAAPAGAAPTPAEQPRLWDQLLEPKPEASLPAMRRLAAHPDVAVALLRAVLKPAASAPGNALLDRLVEDLGDRKFTVREQASRKLDELGETAVVGLRARLPTARDPEVRTRLMRVLAKYDPITLTPEMVREARALEILEQIDTPAARALLKNLAGGAANARRTQAAADVLRRLEQ